MSTLFNLSGDNLVDFNELCSGYLYQPWFDKPDMSVLEFAYKSMLE